MTHPEINLKLKLEGIQEKSGRKVIFGGKLKIRTPLLRTGSNRR